MAPSRTREHNFIYGCIFVLISFCLLIVSASASSDLSPAPSPHADLICHTENPQECYPRVFQPTDEFQTVHDDQELPNGLHIRLNIWTGQKEAKINVPDESNPALEGMPVDRAVILVDQEQPSELPVPKGAPKYEPIGKVKQPPVESGSFYDSLKMLEIGFMGKEESLDAALEGLEDISHDIYYGLKIAEDPNAVKTLFCMMVGAGSSEGAIPRDKQAASILAGALQNNPTALNEVSKVWASLMDSTCEGDRPPLRKLFYSSFMPSVESTPEQSKASPSKAKARVSVINGLIKDPVIRDEFLASGGMRTLLEVLRVEGHEWAAAQRKVGQLVIDNFLDVGMGATLGVWPRTAALGDKQCRDVAAAADEGCWDYEIARIRNLNKREAGHWSKEVYDGLRGARKLGSKGQTRATKEEL